MSFCSWPDQAAFLKAYESREQEMINFLKEHKLVTIPDYLGKTVRAGDVVVVMGAGDIREQGEAFVLRELVTGTTSN